MIHSYDDDEVKSQEEIVKHEKECACYTPKGIIRTAQFRRCTCTPIRGTRIVIEKWDDYVVKVKAKSDPEASR